MSKVYQQEILNGIPVFVKEGKVYTWEREGGEPIEIGGVDSTREAAFNLSDGWEERTRERMLAWREKQSIRSRAKLREGGNNTGSSAAK
jgi:hypothetical protein